MMKDGDDGFSDEITSLERDLAKLKSEDMPSEKYNDNATILRTRLDRLLKEREFRKSSKSIHLNEDVKVTKGKENTLGNGQNVINNNKLPPEKKRPDGITPPKGTADPGHDGENKVPPKQRLLVVANRLPVSAVRRGEEWDLTVSVGGLVSALLGVKFECRWIGWAGLRVSDEIGRITLTQALTEKRCIPVFLEEDIVNQYYNGYCNNILWPLFHYLGLPQEDHLSTTRSFQSQFDAYKRANQMFADVIMQHYEDGDIVWCHDYHLMFLPQYLKDHCNNMKVGWFLHTPFPSSEIYRTLPSRSELLKSVLAADLVGFHTYDYARHFVSACTRILGVEATPDGVEDQGKLTRVAASPIGIDSKRFIRTLELPDVKNMIQDFKERFSGRKVMLGVDRLDMIKGIPQKLLAFEKFLEENPNWRDKVVLVQIAVPTRTKVPEYQKLTQQVHELVGRINGKFGTFTAVPIHHLDRSMDFNELCALYACTDVALVTSLRDGMNLVSYEFTACQDSKKGVLILSEFAGAAQSLGAGAILVNPWNISEVASSIAYALNMPADEREKRHQYNFVYVTEHTSQEWAETVISELNATIVEAQLRTRQIPPSLQCNDAVESYLRSSNRLLILGFNATLTEPVDVQGRRADQFAEMEFKIHPDLEETLRRLCDDKRNTVIVLSGSERSVLDKNFEQYNMWLAAEHGMFLRHTRGEWMTTMPENLVHMDCYVRVKHVFVYFNERTPRSHLKVRETSLVWNYKFSDIEFGKLQAKDLMQNLYTVPIANVTVEVVQGSRSVEVRAAGVSKGAAIDRILAEIIHTKMLNGSMRTPIDYVLCIGHFLPKDEDVYTFFEPEPPASGTARSPSTCPSSRSSSNIAALNSSGSIASSSSTTSSTQPYSAEDKKPCCPWWSMMHNQTSTEQEGPSILDLRTENYFPCTVGRKRSRARYSIESSAEVLSLLRDMALSS